MGHFPKPLQIGTLETLGVLKRVRSFLTARFRFTQVLKLFLLLSTLSSHHMRNTAQVFTVAFTLTHFSKSLFLPTHLPSSMRTFSSFRRRFARVWWQCHLVLLQRVDLLIFCTHWDKMRRDLPIGLSRIFETCPLACLAYFLRCFLLVEVLPWRRRWHLPDYSYYEWGYDFDNHSDESTKEHFMQSTVMTFSQSAKWSRW
jgi:hypothetical protein